MKRNSSKFMALGGVTAALAVVIMSMGTLIPLATYISPMICAVLLTIVLRMTERKVAWAWYGAVAILSLLLAPDKEAAAVFGVLGYYPILKPWFDRRPVSVLWKLVYFNVAIACVFGLTLVLMGIETVSKEFIEAGWFMAVVTWLLANATLFMTDLALTRFGGGNRRG